MIILETGIDLPRAILMKGDIRSGSSREVVRSEKKDNLAHE